MYANSVYAVAEENILSQKIAELRMKSHAHGKFVSELLGNPVEFEPIKVGANSSLQSLASSTKVVDKPLAPTEISSSPPLSPSSDLPDVEEMEVVQPFGPVDDRSSSSLSEESILPHQSPSHTKTPDTYDELINPRFLNEEWGIIWPICGIGFS